MNKHRWGLIMVLLVPVLVGGCASGAGNGRSCDPFCLLRHDLQRIWPAITDTSALQRDCRAIGSTITDTSDFQKTVSAICPPDLDTTDLQNDCRAIGSTACDTSDLQQTLADMHEAIWCPRCPSEY